MRCCCPSRPSSYWCENAFSRHISELGGLGLFSRVVGRPPIFGKARRYPRVTCGSGRRSASTPLVWEFVSIPFISSISLAISSIPSTMGALLAWWMDLLAIFLRKCPVGDFLGRKGGAFFIFPSQTPRERAIRELTRPLLSLK